MPASSVNTAEDWNKLQPQIKFNLGLIHRLRLSHKSVHRVSLHWDKGARRFCLVSVRLSCGCGFQGERILLQALLLLSDKNSLEKWEMIGGAVELLVAKIHSNGGINGQQSRVSGRKLFHLLYTSVGSEWQRSRIYTVCFHSCKVKNKHNGTTSGWEIIHDSYICTESKRLINPTLTLFINFCLLLVREAISENIHFLNLYWGYRDIYFIIIL